MAGAAVGNVALIAQPHAETGMAGRILLQHDDDIGVGNQRHVTGLFRRQGKPVHHRRGEHPQALDRGGAEGMLQDVVAHAVAVGFAVLVQPTAPLHNHQNAEYFAQGTFQPLGDLRGGQPVGRRGQEFDDVEAFFQGGSGIDRLGGAE